MVSCQGRNSKYFWYDDFVWKYVCINVVDVPTDTLLFKKIYVFSGMLNQILLKFFFPLSEYAPLIVSEWVVSKII